MDIATQQRLLSCLAGTFLLGTIGAVYWSAAAIEPAGVAGRPAGKQPVIGEEPVVSAPPADNTRLAMPLRGTLYDPPEPKPTPPPTVKVQPKTTPPPSKPKLNLTLVGTIIQSDQSLAIIADESGKFDVKGVGEPLELSPLGVRIQKIESEQITLQYQGDESTIRLEKKSSGPKGGGGGRRANNRRRIP